MENWKATLLSLVLLVKCTLHGHPKSGILWQEYINMLIDKFVPTIQYVTDVLSRTYKGIKFFMLR